MIAEDLPIQEVARVFNVTTRTISNWVSRFLVERFSWLLGYHYRGRGRKSKFNKEQRDRLYQIIDRGPEEYGFDCGIGTSGIVAEVVFREFDVVYNPRYLSSLLKKMGLSYQKARFESDHLDEKKKEGTGRVNMAKHPQRGQREEGYHPIRR